MAAPGQAPQAGGLDSPILRQIRPEWLERTLARLRQVHPGYDGLPEATRVPLLFDHLFVTDVQLWGAGSLPDVTGLTELRGDFLVQIDEMVDVSKPVKERLGGTGGGSHLFKLLLYDGHRVVVGLEHGPISDLNAGIPRGCKALVRGPVAVFRGCLLLTSESFAVLGGAVEELEAQRRAVAAFVAQPPVGRRGPRPALQEYMEQCRRAAMGAGAGAGAAAAPVPAPPQQTGAPAVAGALAPPVPQHQAAAPPPPPLQHQQQYQAAPNGHQGYHGPSGQVAPAAPPPQHQPPPQHYQQPTQAPGAGSTQLPGSISFGSGRVAPAPGAAQPSGVAAPAASAPPAAPAVPLIPGWDSDDGGWSSDDEDAPLNARGAAQARRSGGAAAAPAAATEPQPEPEVIDLAGDSDEAIPETEPQVDDPQQQQQQGQGQQGRQAGWPADDDETQPLIGQPWPIGGLQTRPAALLETEPQEGPAAGAGGQGDPPATAAPPPAAVAAAEEEDAIERFSQGTSPRRMISYTSGSSGKKKRLRTSAGGSRRSASPSPLAGLTKVTPGAASVAPAAAGTAGVAGAAPSPLRPRPLGPAFDEAGAAPAGGPSRPPPRSPPHYRSPEAAAAARGIPAPPLAAPRGRLVFGDDGDLGPPPPPLAALRVAPPPAALDDALAASPEALPGGAALGWGSQGPQPFTHVWTLSRHVAAAPPAAYPLSATLCGTVAEMAKGGGGGVRVVLEDATGTVTAAVAPALLLALANAAAGRGGGGDGPPPFHSVGEFMAEARRGAEGAALRRAVAAALLAHRGLMEVAVARPGGEPQLVQLLDAALTESQLGALRSRAVAA